jgi:hypothetical protein
VIFNLLEEIGDGSKPFMPATGLKNRCTRCPYGDVCNH